jgi:hypothetical protein
MAITNFIPEVWSASLLSQLRASLAYAQPNIINRNYEGDIRDAGDTVHITSFDDPVVSTYVRNSTINYQTLTDHGLVFPIEQSKYFAFKVDDIDVRQAKTGFIDEVTRGASYGLASDTDRYVSTVMAAGVDPGTQLGDLTVSDPSAAYALLVSLRTILTRTETPHPGRWVVVPPEFYALLLMDDRFISNANAGTTEGLRNGQVGRAAGFDIIESTTVPEIDDEGDISYTLIAGHSIATTYADQILKTQGISPLQDTFGDGVRGLHVYDAKVIRPTNLATVNVEVTA